MRKNARVFTKKNFFVIIRKREGKDEETEKKLIKIVIDYIKQQIMNQELKIGELLPPERDLSEKLGAAGIPFGKRLRF